MADQPRKPTLAELLAVPAVPPLPIKALDGRGKWPRLRVNGMGRARGGLACGLINRIRAKQETSK